MRGIDALNVAGFLGEFLEQSGAGVDGFRTAQKGGKVGDVAVKSREATNLRQTLMNPIGPSFPHAWQRSLNDLSSRSQLHQNFESRRNQGNKGGCNMLPRLCLSPHHVTRTPRRLIYQKSTKNSNFVSFLKKYHERVNRVHGYMGNTTSH